MRFHPIVLIAAAALPGFAQCAEQKGTVLAPASLSMRVDADGTPSGLACGPTVAPELCPVLTKAVSRWRFTPGQRHSAPAAVDIWLSLNLVAVRKAEGFSIQATRAGVSARNPGAAGDIDPESRKMNPPVYPRDELRRGRTGVVILELTPQPGSPHPHIAQVWVGGKPAQSKDPFVQASREAVAKWVMGALPPEQLSTCTTIEFLLGSPKPGKPSPDTAPCVSKYKDGFALPKLLTDPLTASF